MDVKVTKQGLLGRHNGNTIIKRCGRVLRLGKIDCRRICTVVLAGS
jgi:hypothetical protein